MASRVGEMIDDRERLLADVSHELRSPLARMKVALEFMPEGDKGHGIGLNLCQRIAQLHGGEIRLRSRESRGTEAIVSLRGKRA
jgi:signal transduction histidine kinase